MAAPGRNDPCPCGSGRKFKRCCANLAAEPIVTADDRDQAFEVLTKFSETRRFEDDFELTAILFWGEDLVDDLPELDDDEWWLPTLFAEWCLFDYVTIAGGTIAEHALDERRDKFTPGARRFVERCIASPYRLTQVAQVDRGRGFILADLLNCGRTYTVRDALASEDTVRHDVLVARVVPDANDWIIEGVPVRLRVLDKELLLGHIKRVRKRFERETPERSDAMDRMLISRAILSFVVARALFAKPPELHTAEGEALELTDDLLDEPVSIDVDGDAGGLPAEVAAEVEQHLYAEYYRKWIDEPLPALGGRTPREASTIKRLRRRLRTLVEAIENQAAHLALDNRDSMSTGFEKSLAFATNKRQRSVRQ